LRIGITTVTVGPACGGDWEGMALTGEKELWRERETEAGLEDSFEARP
jgi:hypothetical protein